MTAVRWGVLATGWIAGRFVEDLRLLPDVELAAVASRRPDTAEAFARRYGFARAYGSWSQLAADPSVDVVYVATPHAAHHAAATLCLDAGKAVLCEKPLTLDLATARRLVETAQARRVFLMEAMWMRTIPTIRRIAAAVADGAIGDVTHVAADFGVPGPFPVGHRMRAPELGGGALLDLGVYPIALAHLLLGPPQSVAAWAALLPEGTDRNTAVVLGYASGAVATVQAGMVGDTALRATVTGTAGRIEIDRPFYRPDAYTLFDGAAGGDGGTAGRRVTVPVRGNGMGYEAEEVMRCLRAGLIESPLVPHDATLAVMATLDTVRRQIGVEYPTPRRPEA